MYDWHLQHTPDHRIFLYPDEDDRIRAIYWPEVVRAILKAARTAMDCVGNNTENDTPIVAILAASGTGRHVHNIFLKLTLSLWQILSHISL